MDIRKHDINEIYNMNFTPESLGLTPLEFNKLKKRSEKIIFFLNEIIPITMINLTLQYYKEEYYPFFNVLNEIITEFLFGDKKNINYKYYPWKDEIRKRLHENYGFKLN